MATLTIPARFCGPPSSANGGYMAGAVARHLDGVAVPEVTLRRPPPLDTPMDVERDGDVVRVTLAGELVAEGRPGEVEVTVLPPPDPGSIADLEVPDDWFTDHPFATCFTCGPDRGEGDALRIFPRQLPESSPRFAAVVVPPPDLVDGGELAPEAVWAALDCPSYFPFRGQMAVLGRLAVDQVAPAVVDEAEALVVTGWPLGADGRKRLSASALFAGRRLVARAQATWITLPDGDAG